MIVNIAVGTIIVILYICNLGRSDLRLFLLFLLIKHDNLFVWVKSSFTLKRQERQIEQLRRENEELRKAAYELLNNRDSLETFAREEYFFCEPGEDIYIIP